MTSAKKNFTKCLNERRLITGKGIGTRSVTDIEMKSLERVLLLMLILINLSVQMKQSLLCLLSGSGCSMKQNGRLEILSFYVKFHTECMNISGNL